MVKIKTSSGNGYTDDSSLSFKIVKTTKAKTVVILWALIVPLLVTMVLLYFLSTKGFSTPKVDFFYLSILVGLFGTPIIANVIRSFRIAKDYVLEKDKKGVYINKKRFCDHPDLLYIFIQPVVGWKGFGETFTVGLRAKGKKMSLSYDNSNKDMAEEIAQKLAVFLQSKVVMQKKTIFTLYKGY